MACSVWRLCSKRCMGLTGCTWKRQASVDAPVVDVWNLAVSRLTLSMLPRWHQSLCTQALRWVSCGRHDESGGSEVSGTFSIEACGQIQRQEAACMALASFRWRTEIVV